MSSRDDILDLSARARRGQATAEELKRLRSGLGASATLRTAHEVGVDFDGILAVKAADSELVDDVVAKALAASSGARPPAFSRRRLPTLWLAAAAALLCSAGALAWWHGSPKASSRETAPAGSVEVAKRVLPEGAAAVGTSTESVASSKPVEAPAPPQRLAPAAKPSAALDAEATAEALFAKANQARSSGRAAEAIGLYRRLQADHPSSAEALTSRIALGRLLLARGEHAAALRELDRHLSSGGVLAEEALLWKARTLRQMGRSDEEQQVLRALLQRFPNTAYEQEARSRLGSTRPSND